MDDKVKYLLENINSLADESLDQQEIERLRELHLKKLDRYAAEEENKGQVLKFPSRSFKNE